MKSNKKNCLEEYKECAGKECQNLGVHCLKILFLNKRAWFCDSCKDILVASNLAFNDTSDHEIEVKEQDEQGDLNLKYKQTSK